MGVCLRSVLHHLAPFDELAQVVHHWGMDILDMSEWRHAPADVTYKLRNAAKRLQGANYTPEPSADRTAIRYRGNIIGWIIPGDADGPYLQEQSNPANNKDTA